MGMERDTRIAAVGFQAILLVTLAALVTGQSDGLLRLSIDCGTDQPYNDTETTNLEWVPDTNFTSTGKNAQIIAVESFLNSISGRQAKTLRYFDGERPRNCYVLQPVKPRRTYLLRLTFSIGNWTSGHDVFDVYINATHFLHIDSSILANFYTVYEAIFYCPGGAINVCLVRQHGTPHISALELREFSEDMYDKVTDTNKLLSLLIRANAGATESRLFTRYPDDEYDRIWLFVGDEYPRTNGNVTSTSQFYEKPPRIVMEDAWIANSSSLSFGQAINLTGLDGVQLAVYSYFQEVDGTASASNVRGVEYIVNGNLVTTFNVSDQPVGFPPASATITNGQYNVTLQRAPGSRLPPILNAYETYIVSDLNTSETNVTDANAIAQVKKVFNLMNWDGDPCFPIPFTWLNCKENVSIIYNSQNAFQSTIVTFSVTNLTLEDAATTTLATIPEEIGHLTALTELNLANKGFNEIGTSLANSSALTVLDLSNNNFSIDMADFNTGVISPSVKYLYMANNSLRGQLSIDGLLEAFPYLQEVHLDGNTDINGRLNISTWLASLRGIMENELSENSSANVLISLKDCKIDDVYPSDVDVSPTLEEIYNSNKFSSLSKGILLFGNPWCNRTSSKDQSFARQYLCRSSIGTSNLFLASPRRNSSSHKVAIIVGTIVGSCALLACCILFVVIWRLGVKSAALGEIQEALAKQQVHPPFYSYSDLRKATNNFSTRNKLGRGAYGAVYKGTLGDGILVAVKVLFPSKLALSEFLNEAVLISGIKHKHLVQLKGCCINDDERMLVFELAQKGNLAEALWGTAHNEADKKQSNKVPLDWEKRLNICLGIGRGLSYLHEELQPRIVHRDIKPENILIDTSFNAKIADFGLARSFLEEESQAAYTHLAGTMGYFAPEYVFEGQLTEKADVYSYGIVLLEVLSGRKCIDRKLSEDQVSLYGWANLLRKQGALLELLDPSADIDVNKEEMYEVLDIAFLCLNMDPSLRPKMSEAVTLLQRVLNVSLNESDHSLPFQKKLSNYLGTRASKLPSTPYLENLEEDIHLVDSSTYDDPSTSSYSNTQNSSWNGR